MELCVKRKGLRSPLWVAVLVLLSGCAATRPLETSVSAAIDRPPFQHAFWSILVEDDDGKVLFSQNAAKLNMPASNRKLFASAAIASCLGETAQLSTSVWLDGADVVIRGDGDPSLGSWRFARDGDFQRVATRLREKGITRVRDVVSDVSSFDRLTIPGGWKHGNLGADYAAPVDAIAWNENEVPVDRSIEDPGLHAASALRDALLFEGIEVTGTPRVNTDPRAWGEKVLELPSPFIGHLLATVLKNSHNLYAEMLLKRIGGGTYEGAFAVERSFLTTEPRLAGDAFRFVDGSGLAPDNLVTAEATIRLLRWMNHPARRGFWWSTLVQPNQDGTLRRRLIALENRLRGKTGTINGVNALAGILAMPDGRFRYFVVVVNHHAGEGSEALKIIDEVVGLIGEP